MADDHRPWAWQDFLDFKHRLGATMEVLRQPDSAGKRVRGGLVYRKFMRENRSARMLVRSADFGRTSDDAQHRLFSLFQLYWALRAYGDDRAILRLEEIPTPKRVRRRSNRRTRIKEPAL